MKKTSKEDRKIINKRIKDMSNTHGNKCPICGGVYAVKAYNTTNGIKYVKDGCHICLKFPTICGLV